METDLINVRTVGRPSFIPVFYEYMKEFTLERSPMHVNNVAKPSGVQLLFRFMREPIPERSLINVRNVGNPFVLGQPFEYT